jgi:branched-chain amino acid transport system ATP-binding protein
MTVAENLALGVYARRSAGGARATMERQLALFPVLAERRNQRADTLSGGEQQMVAIARALMGNPKLLLLDEPSLGLGPRLTKELFSTLRSITRGGQSVLLVEQNVHHSLRLADRVHVLENGRVVRSGTRRSSDKTRQSSRPISGSDGASSRWAGQGGLSRSEP